MDRVVLGKRIREERIRSCLTQEQTAEYINVSTTYVGLIERGERSITLEKLILLAECFHVTVDFLLRDVVEIRQDNLDIQLLSLWNEAGAEEKDLILTVIKSVLDYSSKK